jgi:uncharacterized lipoprotein YmbA
MKRLAAALACLVLAGCGTAPAEQARTVELGIEATLAPGSTVAVKGTALNVRFVSVSEDSRCPKDVNCIWAGEVRVQLEIQLAQDVSRVEFLEGGTKASGPYRVMLVRVEPQPTSKARVAPQDYRATLKIERVG